MIPLDDVIRALDGGRQRATYGAVGMVTGSPAAFLMGGRPRNALNSWVVNQESQLPTGYSAAETHPELRTNPRVITDGNELRDWLGERGVVDTDGPAQPRLDDNPWLHLANRELQEAYCGIMDALRIRDVVRSYNNPVADLAEQLGKRAFRLDLSMRSERGYDARSEDGLRWQIKGRRRTSTNPSSQLSVLRDLETQQFDILLAIYFDEHFQVKSAHKIQFQCVLANARYSRGLRGHRLIMTQGLRRDPGCEDVTAIVREAAGAFLDSPIPLERARELGHRVITLNDLLAYVQAERRVCPVPHQWAALWELLPDRRQDAHGAWTPPQPLILGAWHHTSALDKMLRLREQIEYASARGARSVVASFLTQLPESEWVHLGEV